MKKLYTPLPKVMSMYLLLTFLLAASYDVTIGELMLFTIQFKSIPFTLCCIIAAIICCWNLFIYMDDGKLVLGNLFGKNTVIELSKISQITWVKRTVITTRKSRSYILECHYSGCIEEYRLDLFIRYNVKNGIKKMCEIKGIEFRETADYEKLHLRPASIDDVDTLNHLAYESEGIWGEDNDYMVQFCQDYKVTIEMIEDEHVCILECDDIVTGFFVLLKRNSYYELELFYIDKLFIGKGYGKKLWLKMIEYCGANNIGKIQLVASDDVLTFYKRLGASELSKVNSTLKKGRVVTRMTYDI